MELSVVTTLYKTRPFLETYLSEMNAVLKRMNITDYELLFVNDGSPDDSVPYLLEKKLNDRHIRIVDLSRNFGHHYALQAGLAFASGNYVYMADCDLETPVSVLEECYKTIISEPEYDYIYCVQEVRKGHFLEKIGGAIFWALFNAMSDSKAVPNAVTESIMSRKFVNEFLKLNDANLFLGGMLHWMGFKKKPIYVKKTQRKGQSSYTFSKRLRLLINAMTSFSGKPLEWLFYLGLTMSILSMIFLVYLLIKKLVLGPDVSLGWTSLAGINVLVLGVMTTFLGLIGMYVYRIYKQVQGRPNVIIRKIY